MKSILISHSNREPDKTISMELYSYLSQRKIDCWIDALIKASSWRGQIGKVMLETPIVIFVASRNSIAETDEVMKEVLYYQRCRNEGKIVIPFVLDEQFYLHPVGANEAFHEFIYEFGSNSLQAVFAERYPTHEQAFERLIQVLPDNVVRLDNNPADFVYEKGDEILTEYHGSDSCVSIPPYVKEIAREAFMNNDTLQKVIIPPSVKKIGLRAFYGCSQLSDVEGMEGLEEIEASAFDESGIAPRAENGYTISGIAFGGEPVEGTLHFCEGTRIIANEAFRYSNAHHIELPQSLKYVGTVAFADCIFIKDLKIPASVARLGKNAFRGCRKLERVVFEGEAPQDADQAFDNLSKIIDGENR